MAEVVWTEPALADFDAIADYIALDDLDATRRLVQRVFQHVDRLAPHPESGAHVRELGRGRYRQIVEPPLRAVYRYDGATVWVVHVLRSRQRLRKKALRRNAK